MANTRDMELNDAKIAMFSASRFDSAGKPHVNDVLEFAARSNSESAAWRDLTARLHRDRQCAGGLDTLPQAVARMFVTFRTLLHLEQFLTVRRRVIAFKLTVFLQPVCPIAPAAMH